MVVDQALEPQICAKIRNIKILQLVDILKHSTVLWENAAGQNNPLTAILEELSLTAIPSQAILDKFQKQSQR